jgi:hypothetical protein
VSGSSKDAQIDGRRATEEASIEPGGKELFRLTEKAVKAEQRPWQRVSENIDGGYPISRRWRYPWRAGGAPARMSS